MNLISYFFIRLWQVGIDHVLPLLALLLLGMLVPRLGRLAIRVLESRLDESEESTKARLALGGALVYVLQAVAYFLLVLTALSNLGVPALGAAIPATVVSAALGFGAQKIIGDFLAGFFILSEKQFGVGDYVSFDGATGVEGTVVALTLRTTKVRTPTGEVVMVPNGSAGVVTNYSQDWSRAVVDLAVPLHEGETLEEITTQVRSISEQAIQDPTIADDVAGELEILSATGIVEPTVAGQPWQVKYRVLVQVNPSRQWAVERAIRSALLSAFWDHYNLPADAAGAVPFPMDRITGAASPDTDAPGGAKPSAQQPVRAEDPEESAAAAMAASESASNNATKSFSNAGDSAHLETDAVESKDHGPGRPATADADPDLEDADAHTSIWRQDASSGKFRRLWTLGGRVRSSTTSLLVGLLVTGLLLFASWNPEDAGTGWLNPAYWTERKAPATTSAPVPTAEPEVSATENPGADNVTEESADAYAPSSEPNDANSDGAAADENSDDSKKNRDERRMREDTLGGQESTAPAAPTPQDTAGATPGDDAGATDTQAGEETEQPSVAN
ncbi:transport protein of the small conductance mechanosensitive ion channel family [Corynebacterium striatum]|uniref:mechanosensitive ion channel family protein n=1 Tax=Corynebacterium striatum TaxID=43770 RepID=UPI000E016FF4|nr:mechanosensitive ion channel family protein [Corynebacterium striatum]STD38125.1 transport protein of the small conductance mechanosensitive ion channel family [Corynebacterium striatum]